MPAEKITNENTGAKKSPDELNNYIRVTNPAVWLLIVAMLSLVIGALCWGILGHIDRTVETAVSVENGKVTCYVYKDDMEEVQVGMTVSYFEEEGTITEIGEESDGTYLCTIEGTSELSDGIYFGTITVEKIAPISFLME